MNGGGGLMSARQSATGACWQQGDVASPHAAGVAGQSETHGARPGGDALVGMMQSAEDGRGDESRGAGELGVRAGVGSDS